MNAQVAEIHKLDPTINRMEDLVAMPNARAFYEKVRAGNSLVDAFWLVNREKLTAQTAEAARQQALNAARSKEHLTRTGAAVGTGSEEVPPDVMAQYRYLNPELSAAEIREHWNKRKR